MCSEGGAAFEKKHTCVAERRGAVYIWFMFERASTFSTTLLAVLAFVAPSRAHAEPDAARFSWIRESGAEACIGEDELRRKIVAMLGRDPFADPSGPTVAGVVRREGDVLVATISSRPPGEALSSRELRADATSCGPLTDAVVLAVALSVERAPAAAPAEPPRPAPAWQTAPAPARVEQAPPGSGHASDDVAALAQAQWTLGWLPRPTTGVGLALHYKVAPRLTVAGGGLWLPAASHQGQFSEGLATTRLGACFETVRAAQVSLVQCAYGLAGATNVQNEAGKVPDAGTHAWFAGSLTAAAMARFGSTWAAEAGAEGTVPFARPIYATTDCPRVGFQQPVATLGVFLSVGAFFL
jgi:hypothetical protein